MEKLELNDETLIQAKKIIKNNETPIEPRYRFNLLGSQRPFAIHSDIIELKNWASFVAIIQWFFIALPIYLYAVVNDEILAGCFGFLSFIVYIVGYYFIKFSKDLEDHLYRYGFMLYEKRKKEEK